MMKNRIIGLFTAAVVACGIFSAPVQTFFGSEYSAASAATVVSAPKSNRVSGTYYASGTLKVTLSCATKGATIYYSLNGSSYRTYTSGIYISKNSTLKVYAKANGVNSKVVSYTYKLAPSVNISAAAGEYDEPQTIKLSSPVPGVKFYYTLDGTKPTTSSALYNAKGITISKSATLRIMAVKANWTTRYISKNYVINSNTETVSAEDLSILDDYTSKYAYSTLTSAQKKAYAAIFNAAKNHDEAADVSKYGISETDLSKAYWAFDYDNPQFFWLDNGYSYSYINGKVLTVYIMYSRTKTEAQKLLPAFESAANKIIAEALKYNNDFDRLKVLHDSLINMTSYTSVGAVSKSEADGPLLNGKALCEGYSKAFMYLCQSIGIQCICVSGGGHMWNMVKVNGDWYHIDVTWDDPVSTTPILRYDYFCVSTKTISSDHIISNWFTIPSAVKNYTK